MPSSKPRHVTPAEQEPTRPTELTARAVSATSSDSAAAFPAAIDYEEAAAQRARAHGEGTFVQGATPARPVLQPPGRAGQVTTFVYPPHLYADHPIFEPATWWAICDDDVSVEDFRDPDDSFIVMGAELVAAVREQAAWAIRQTDKSGRDRLPVARKLLKFLADGCRYDQVTNAGGSINARAISHVLATSGYVLFVAAADPFHTDRLLVQVQSFDDMRWYTDENDDDPDLTRACLAAIDADQRAATEAVISSRVDDFGPDGYYQYK